MTPPGSTAAAHDDGGNVSLSIKDLRLTGAGRWLVVAMIAAGSAGGGGYLGMQVVRHDVQKQTVPVVDVLDYADTLRNDIKDMRTEQRAQGERLARIEAFVEELRGRGK